MTNKGKNAGEMINTEVHILSEGIDDWEAFRLAEKSETPGDVPKAAKSRTLVIIAYCLTIGSVWGLSKAVGNTNSAATFLSLFCAAILFLPVLGYLLNPQGKLPEQKEDMFLDPEHKGLNGNIWND